MRSTIFTSITALFLGACTGDGSSSEADGGTLPDTSAGSSQTGATSDPSGSGPTSAPTDSTTSETTTVDPDGTSDESTGGPPAVPEVHWVGRYDDTDPAAVRMGWSGVGLVARWSGTGATVRMDDQGRYFTVVVDGALQPTLATSSGMQDYVLATDLPPGEHTVELYRRTEGSFGDTVIAELVLEGELLAPPPVTRRMELVGDSITAGYGNEGVSPCSFSAETENHYQTYGAIASRTLGAELHTVAWSGKGIIYNYGDDMDQPLPELYDRTLASDGAAWGFGWQPDVVAVNLGTNDFSTGNDPPQGLFVDTYVGFLAHLRDMYPEALLLVLQPTLFGAEADMVQGYLEDVVAQRQAAGDANVAYADVNVDWIGSGCDGHPTVATHEGMAGLLAQELQSRLGW